MTEPQDMSAGKVNGKTRKPTVRGIVLWSAGILIALFLAWFIGAVAVPVWQVRRAVQAFDKPGGHSRDLLEALGGPERAVGKLSMYLRMPESIAPHKEFAALLLANCGSEAVPVLIQTLSSRDPMVRSGAAVNLARIGPEAREAVPALIGALCDESPSVRSNAAAALTAIGPEARAAVPALTKALGDSDSRVRKYAAYALARIGPAAREAVPALTRLLEEAENPVDYYAALALYRIGPDEAAIPALERAFKKGRGPGVSGTAHGISGHALWNSGPIGRSAFLRALDSKNLEVRLRTARLLGIIGPAAKEAVPALKKALKDEVGEVREAAAEALKKIRGERQKEKTGRKQ